MAAFTELELAALHSIFAETPELQDALERQLAGAAVAKRENTGAGFFTTIAVADDVPRVSSPRVLGQVTYADVAGLQYGLGFVLFMDGGALSLLEGYCISPEGTASLDLAALSFELREVPTQRLG